MSDELDFSLYVRAPVFNAAGGLALARALLSAVPKGATPGMRKAARRLRAAALMLQEQVLLRARAARAPDPRPVDQAVDAAVGALHARLAAYAALPAEPYALAIEAQDLLERLFPNGLTLLRLPYQEEWAAVDGLVRLIDREGMAKDLDRLCGKEFLENVRAQLQRYGDALGITHAAGPTVDASLAEPRRALAKAMTAYAMQVMASIEDGGSLEAARGALQPFDGHRAALGRRGRASAETPAVRVDGDDTADGDPAMPIPLAPEGDGA